MSVDQEALERIFPGIDDSNEDILGGVADETDGKVVLFLRNLSPEDRELVTWFALQHIGNSDNLQDYLVGLVRGYAVTDPGRTSEPGKLAALAEITRIERFTEIFLAEENFFPAIAAREVEAEDEDTGELVEFYEAVWIDMADSRFYGICVDFHRQRETMMAYLVPIIEPAKAFIQSNEPNDYFDQDIIMHYHYHDMKAQEMSMESP